MTSPRGTRPQNRETQNDRHNALSLKIGTKIIENNLTHRNRKKGGYSG